MGQTPAESPSLFSRVWDSQRQYNQRLRDENRVEGKEGQTIYWAKQYLLGLITEVDEVLREMNWKWHRAGFPEEDIHRRNLGLELADLTKYVLSLWELFGFGSNDLLTYVAAKTDQLEQQYQMDFNQIPSGKIVIISDLDGTIADWRRTFSQWMADNGLEVPRKDMVNTLLYDYDNGIRFMAYQGYKAQFEASGGYADLIPYRDGLRLIERLSRELEAEIVYFTARPNHRYQHIWLDTFSWLRRHNLPVSKLFIGSVERIEYALTLRKIGHPVAMLEDDPEIIQRARANDIPVLVREQPYNAYLKPGSSGALFTEDFSDGKPYEWLAYYLKWREV